MVRVIGITPGAMHAVERGAVRGRQRPAVFHPRDQVGIGNERTAEGDQVELPVLQRTFRAGKDAA